MKKLFGNSRGQIMIVYAAAVATLVGVLGLCADVGVFYVNWEELQKAADAAVLAGAAGLPANTPGATAAVNYYLGKNGVASPDVITGPTISNANTQISVTVKRTVPYFFGGALGLVNTNIQVTATAQSQTANTPGGGIFPAGLNLAKFPTLKFDGTQYDIYGTSNNSPGNKGPVDIAGDGNPFPYMGLTPFTGTLTAGETIPVVTGCKNGHADGPLAARMAAGLAMDPNGTWNNHTVGNPQQVVLPVGTFAGNGSNATFTISQFVDAWIEPGSSGCSVTVSLMPGAAGGTKSNGTACTAGNGICTVALIQ
jgi:Flp pilus assembly protein TadG